ncbi:MAG: CpsB/CapC family capsule biosynthesis tyrosine phosphatase [Mucilaginibacter sp.]|uniref:tyrosine-protein phosphatase n=1 Tax=Mucilaginibacter sp. TaxID=1882438 RepID=UPI0032636C30
MFGFFKRKAKNLPLNFNAIGVDMHSHILPGIDDGAGTVEDSIILIKEMIDGGIQKIIATPHVMWDYYRNTPETVNEALNTLKAELTKQGINIPIEAAAEYFFDEHFIELVNNNTLLTMGNGKYVLVEFGFITAPPAFIMTIQKLKANGIQPILAHPERYLYYKIDELKNLKDWGFQFQINTISLTGYYGKETKKMAEELVDRGLVDFISSDMHHLRHAEAFLHSLRMPYVQRLLNSQSLKNKQLL